MAKNLSPLQRVALALVRFYQLAISPWFGSRCRFYPTCSQYAIEAINTHGGIKGIWLTVKRLLRCHPLQSGGFDPVPDTKQKSEK